MVNIIMTSEEYYKMNADQLLEDLNQTAGEYYMNLYNVKKDLHIMYIETWDDHYVVLFNLDDLRDLVEWSTLHSKEVQNDDLRKNYKLYFPNIKCVELFVRESSILLQIMMRDYCSRHMLK